MAVTNGPDATTLYYPYAFIGLRKSCPDCNFFWEDHSPLTFTNWYGNDPDYSYNDCVWIWMAPGSIDGQWMDWPCHNVYNGICQFYPSGKPNILKPVLPQRAGCRAGWWAFAGY